MTTPLPARAAQVLRKLALDEQLKQTIPTDPVLGPLARKVAGRFVAGESLSEAAQRVEDVLARGHRANVEYMGESCRDPHLADTETEVFLEAAKTMPAECSISLDLSHIGLAIDPELALANATRIAEATAGSGREMMISAEGSDRTDAVLALHRTLSARFEHVGITIQARLHRTAGDLKKLLQRPGRIRLVKGAFLEPESIAYTREDPALADAYLSYAKELLDAGHRCSFATHDWNLIRHIDQYLDAQASDSAPWEFETLMGLGPDHLDAMAAKGHPTREYVVFGTEWWLYVCNRLAEDPQRLFQAVVDAAS
ncbi:proline dehydrogenase [Arthrobacter sp. SW1]|uniref:proline dehydrogenase family protein n=1 Tax=Arthrobacter sp. SW1 TaxID=1920889 RepID=UPI000877D175|nr:proline dehydrogenase family protein [Arthrobacter sp. SW1]OFI36857.1 proline dehydrogenase [Arthrobacter sp. SW1]